MTLNTHVDAIRFLREQGYVVENAFQSRTTDDQNNSFHDECKWNVYGKGAERPLINTFDNKQLLAHARLVQMKEFLN
jgi:hypothetical protein